MAIGELSLPSWLGPGEPAGAPLLRGAQAGSLIRSSFLAARQQKMRESQMQLEEEEKRALLQGHLLQQRAVQQDMQLQALKIADAMKRRDAEVEAESALSTFSDRIRRAKILGPNEPAAQRGVVEWAERYRGLLTLPAGKALWEDYMNSVEEDRKNAAQLQEIKARNDMGVEIANIRADAMIDAAQLRAGAQGTFMPEELTLPSGVKLIRVGPRQFKFAPKQGEERDLTPSQLLSLGQQLERFGDASSAQSAAKIRSWLAEKAVEQMGKVPAPKTVPPPTTTPAPAPPATGKIKVRRLSDGKPGTLNAEDFDPALYERLP